MNKKCEASGDDEDVRQREEADVWTSSNICPLLTGARMENSKPPERDHPVFSQLKSIKSLRRAGITAVFTGQTRVDLDHKLMEVPTEEVIMADIDSLVPTHDEAGCPIAEWKRQVMVRTLQARLLDEEEYSGLDTANGCMAADPVEGWTYSQVHNAVLGPFGELLTQDDLLYLERQLETASLQKRCQVYELELARLAAELRTLLPDPIVNIAVNTDFLRQVDVEGHLPLPVWCGRVSGIVRNMSLLLTSLSGHGELLGEAGEGSEGGAESQGHGTDPLTVQEAVVLEPVPQEEGAALCRIPHVGMASAFSHRLETQSYSRGRREKVEREIQQSGVSVRTLRSNFEGQIGGIYPFAGVVSGSQRPDGSGALGVRTTQGRGVETARADSPISNTGRHDVPVITVMETTSLRKERIVVLFLSHWKKSAYAITMRAARVRQEQENTRVTHSPEHFLPLVDGVPVSYDSMTLDLFMLGYFHILEQDLSAEERKMRHLLCFEVFDHVGSFPWETVRDFHRAVLHEIQANNRQWSHGFEDIKARFFGNSDTGSLLPGRHPHHHQGGPPSSSPSVSPSEAMLVPKVVVQTDDGALLRCSGAGGTDFSCFSNDEICQYIDRSFAFWKQKEAELFDFEH
ncbi:espin-like protein [Aplochiton taeniatus]